MTRSFVVFAVVALATIALLADVTSANTRAHHAVGLKLVRGEIPAGWSAVRRAASQSNIELVFAVSQKNMPLLRKTLYDISDPRSVSFGKHLTFEQVNEMTANPEAELAVERFLLSNGVDAAAVTKTVSGNFITASMSVSVAEGMLRTEFYEFEHEFLTRTTVKAMTYQLPIYMTAHLDFVSANCLFPSATRRSPVVSFAPNVKLGGPIPAGYIYPANLLSYYGITDPTVASTQATQSVYENLGQSFAPSDLASFQKQFNVTANPVATVIGPNKPLSCLFNPNNCVEALLDLEYMMAVAQNSPMTFWSIPDSDSNPFLSWVVAVSNDANPPYVHSISYGDIEPQDDFSADRRFDDELVKLGARGVSVIVASGDDGVANFIARDNQTACGFTPSFPATSPHVTAVGATQGPEDSQTEIACTSKSGGGITTGGGFSVDFPQPSYQQDAVQAFLSSSNLPPSTMFNASNRGYPDVAMLGHNYITVIGGKLSAGSGTSASSPVFGAVITLANGIRLSKGKSALGFLNPTLYYLYQTKPSVFRDITSGENNCCAGDPTSAVCCDYGFYAGAGWDPLTGLGSVRADLFIEALVDL